MLFFIYKREFAQLLNTHIRKEIQAVAFYMIQIQKKSKYFEHTHMNRNIDNTFLYEEKKNKIFKFYLNKLIYRQSFSLFSKQNLKIF